MWEQGAIGRQDWRAHEKTIDGYVHYLAGSDDIQVYICIKAYQLYTAKVCVREAVFTKTGRMGNAWF